MARSLTCCYLRGGDLAAARRFFTRALRAHGPGEVTTDRAAAYPWVIDELIPSALHTVGRYANNPIEADHGRLKARLRPMRGLKRHRSARFLAAGHAFVQNLHRGHCGLATGVPARHRLGEVFDQLAMSIGSAGHRRHRALSCAPIGQRTVSSWPTADSGRVALAANRPNPLPATPIPRGQ
jgi:DDE domain